MKCTARESPAKGSLNMRLSDWQSRKYCLARDLKLSVKPTILNFGMCKGEEIKMEERPFSKESGSHTEPGFPIKSIKNSLQSYK